MYFTENREYNKTVNFLKLYSSRNIKNLKNEKRSRNLNNLKILKISLAYHLKIF